MAKKGRPTTYFDLVQPRLEEVKDWAGQGLTRPEIASRLSIDRATLHRYMNDHTELSDAIKSGDAEIVANVEAALAKKAIGGDVTAMIFFLKNKAPGKWRDKQDHNVNLSLPEAFARVHARRKSDVGGE